MAETATFTGDGVNQVILYCFKPTHLLAKSTLSAFLFVDNGNLPAPKLIFFPNPRLEEEIKVSSIHIAVN
jgi:hypothetical protein